jgi:hypothetical protein
MLPLPVLPPVLGMPEPVEPPPVLGMPALLPPLLPLLLLLPLLPLLPELLPELPPELPPDEPALPELLPELGEPELPESSPHPLTISAALMAKANSDGRTQRPVTLKEPTLNGFISFYLVCRRSGYLTPPRGPRPR